MYILTDRGFPTNSIIVVVTSKLLLQLVASIQLKTVNSIDADDDHHWLLTLSVMA